MILSYPRSEWSRAGAWADVLRRRPAWGTNGRLWRPSDRDFRKAHNDTHWRWYVHYWRGWSTPDRADAPPPIDVGGQRFVYVPYTQTEHDGTLSHGFVSAVIVCGEVVRL